MIEQDTIKLLRECDAGVKMGVSSIDDVMDEAGLPLLGIVPEDENVPLAAAFEAPLLKYTRKGAAAACKRIAKRIQGLPVPIDLR